VAQQSVIAPVDRNNGVCGTFARLEEAPEIKELTMKKFMSGLLATTLAASFAFASMVPVNAAPIFVPRTEAAQTDVQTVQYQPRRKVMGRHYNRVDRRLDRQADARFYRRGGVGYYNGHRGYREYHRGYRRYNDWWFPAGAFIAGAMITGAVNNAARSDNAHVSWCYDHYRSYRASDNTFQPTNGPRRACNSPY
jgi:hypothetical protein